MSIRPELNLYGFGNATALAVTGLEALELVYVIGSFITILIPLVIVKYQKKKALKEIVLVLLSISVFTTGKTFQTELLDLQLTYTWLQESKLELVVSSSEEYQISPTNLLVSEHETASPLAASLQTAEILHEQKTKVFYTIILTSLKALHSAFVSALLIIISIQYVKTTEMSYHLTSVIILNAMFMCIFGLLSHLPSILEELIMFKSTSSSIYDSTP